MSLRPTLLQHASALSTLAPPVAAILARWRITPAQRWIVIWCVLIATRDGIGLALGTRGINNLWLSYLFQPLIGAAALWALAYWQPTDTSRAALRYAIPLFVAVSVLLIVAIEDRRTFSLVASPFHHIVLLLASLWTFLRLSLAAEEAIWRQDWFWITGGLMLFAAASTAIGPLAWYFLEPRVELLHAMFNVRAAAHVAALAAITWGILWQKRQTFSGGSSSPLSLPSSSSSAGSASRW